MKSLVFALFLTAILSGCSKPPPIVTAKSIENPELQSDEWKNLPKPAKSDDAGTRMLAECLAAHTGGKPEKLAEFRLLSFERHGKVKGADGLWYDIQWNAHAEWPGKYAVEFKIKGQLGVEVRKCRLNGENCYDTYTSTTFTKSQPDNTSDARMQMHEDSILYLAGLVDPAIVVVAGPDEKVNDKPIPTLHVWTPQIPFLKLSVHPTTKRIVRIRYLGRELGKEYVKDVVISDTTDALGVQLPSKYTVSLNGNSRAMFETLIANPVKSFDAKVFAAE